MVGLRPSSLLREKRRKRRQSKLFTSIGQLAMHSADILMRRYSISRQEARRLIRQAAKELGVSVDTVQYWIKNGNLDLASMTEFTADQITAFWRRRKKM